MRSLGDAEEGEERGEEEQEDVSGRSHVSIPPEVLTTARRRAERLRGFS